MKDFSVLPQSMLILFFRGFDAFYFYVRNFFVVLFYNLIHLMQSIYSVLASLDPRRWSQKVYPLNPANPASYASATEMKDLGKKGGKKRTHRVKSKRSKRSKRCRRH